MDINNSGVEFESLRNTRSYGQSRVIKSNMAAFVIRISHGIIKTENQANLLLLIITIVFFLLSLLLFFSGPSSSSPVDVSNSQIVPIPVTEFNNSNNLNNNNNIVPLQNNINIGTSTSLPDKTRVNPATPENSEEPSF